MTMCASPKQSLILKQLFTSDNSTVIILNFGSLLADLRQSITLMLILFAIFLDKKLA